MDSLLARLAAGKYVLLTTFRKDGSGVHTPVWVGRDGEALIFWSLKSAGKVKRLRRDTSVELTACDFRGNPTGPTAKATAELVDFAPDVAEQAQKAFVRKYGLMGRITTLAARLRRGRDEAVCYAVTSTLE